MSDGVRSSTVSLIGGQNDKLDARERAQRAERRPRSPEKALLASLPAERSSPKKTSPSKRLVELPSPEERLPKKSSLEKRSTKKSSLDERSPKKSSPSKKPAESCSPEKRRLAKLSEKPSGTMTAYVESKEHSEAEAADWAKTSSKPADGQHPFVKATMLSKIYGCLIGSAVGDCIGLYTEFMTKSQAAKHYPEKSFRLTEPTTPLLKDSHRKRFGENVWTDDTDQALLILLGYLHNGKTDYKDFAERLYVWVNQGLRALDTPPLGLGATVAAAVLNPLYQKDPVAASYAAWKDTTSTPYFGAANGSLMRTHPLGAILAFKPLDELWKITTEYGLVTHPNPKCIVSCCIVVGLIRGFLLGEITTEGHIDRMIRESIKWTDRWDDARRRKIDRKDPRLVEEPRLDHEELMLHVSTDIKSLEDLDLDGSGKIGYVYKSLGATVFLLRSAMRQIKALENDYSATINLVESGKLFEQLITDLVMEAGDADTNACPAAAVLGAYLGYNAVPQYWRDGLKHGDFLKDKVSGLCEMLGLIEGDYDGKKDKHTAPDGGNGFLTEGKKKKSKAPESKKPQKPAKNRRR